MIHLRLTIIIIIMLIGPSLASLSSSEGRHYQLNKNIITKDELSHDTTLVSHTMTYCEFYNRTMCQSRGGFGRGCGGDTEECRPSDGNDRATLCYALWYNTTEKGYQPEYKGCWVGNAVNCNDRDICLERRREAKKGLFFCCCEGDKCNRNITHIPSIGADSGSKDTVTLPEALQEIDDTNPVILIIIVVSLIAIAVIVIAVYSFRRYRKTSRFNELPTSEPSVGWSPPTPYVSLRPLQLVEVKAQGRFGAVWKARDGDEKHVAVKIFPPQDAQSWTLEQEVYRLPLMKHENVLKYLGAEKRGDGINAEYWLITEYHTIGSLWDYLKAHVVTWPQFLQISVGIARGLTHVHEEIQMTRSGYLIEEFKPAIAHRDFKSKNVLLKSDLTACIADFGLALIFYPKHGSKCSESHGHGQVGTRRYMAPEVLDGAINFSRDAFLRIDMYACALVLWELMTRCSAQDGPIGEYQLPFEEEIGGHPTLEDMQEVVVRQKKRPLIRETWMKHTGMAVLCDTLEECWDHDPEARLSASCVNERLESLIRHNVNC